MTTRFRATLVAGRKAPYATWTFLELPPEVPEAWGRGPFAVRGTIDGASFRGTVSRGDGVWRMPVPRTLQEHAGVVVGDTVDVAVELDPEPRPVEVPEELAAVLAEDPDLAERFEALPPSHRRAWAQHVAEAKRPETRQRRARNAIVGIRGKTFPGE